VREQIAGELPRMIPLCLKYRFLAKEQRIDADR